MTKLCPRGKAAAKRKFKVYPSAYANAYASKICAGKIKDPSGVKRKDFRGPKPSGAKKGAMMIIIGIGKKKKVQKKMGGGMPTAGGMSAMGRLQKARMMNKGGGADTGTMGERKSKLGVALQRVKRTMKKDGRLSRKDIEFAKQTLKFKKMNKGGGADYMNTVKPRKRGNPAVVSNTADDRAIKKGITRKKNMYSGGGMARGGGAAIRGNNFQGIF